MTKEEAIRLLVRIKDRINYEVTDAQKKMDALNMAIKALEQEMTAEEYRQRMIQAFHNADTDELIAVCVLPTEKEFEHLEWLLKNHYKKEPCADAVSRQYLIEKATSWDKHFADGIRYVALTDILNAPSVTPQPKQEPCTVTEFADRCQECGAKYGKLLKFAENVLDKIRAELHATAEYHDEDGGYYLRDELIDEIFDKYKTESENKKYEAKVITRGKCMMCGKELTEGLFFCKECGDKANSGK